MNTTRLRGGVLAALGLGCGLPLIGSAVAHALLSHRRWIDVPLHATLEALGIFAGLTLAAILLMLRRHNRDLSHYLCTAGGLICMGVLDGYHALSQPGNLFVWFRSTATLLGGLGFVMVWLPERMGRSRSMLGLPLLAFLATVLLAIGSFAWPETVPAMMEHGQFTAASCIMNALGGVAFLMAGVWYALRSQRTTSADDFLLATLSFLFGMAGVLFWLSQVWGADWWWWHFIRLAAYLLVLVRLLTSYHAIYNSLNDLTRTLEQRLSERTARVQAILDTATDAIITIDERGLVDFLNPAAEKIFGYPASELIGQNITRLMPASARDERDQYSKHQQTPDRTPLFGLGRELIGLYAITGQHIPAEVERCRMRHGSHLHGE